MEPFQMPPSEDLQEVKTQLAILTAAVDRMGKHMSAYTTLDKDISLVQLNQSHTIDAVSHVRERLEQNAAASIRADEIIHRRVDDIAKDSSSFQARATGGFYVVCAMGTLVVTLCTWALTQITKSAEVNIEQSQRLLSVERSVGEIERRLSITKGESK